MKTIKTILLISILSVFAAACKPTSKPLPEAPLANYTCELSQSKIVSVAFDETQVALSNTSCWSDFDAHFNNLLSIASGDPTPEHKKTFADFLRRSEAQGIISKVQLKQTYTRYFTGFFASLPKDESNCKAGQDINKLTRNLDTEMRDKQKGLLKAMGARDEFSKAKRDRDAIILIVAAAGEACQV
jgi:hypothetical protein